MDSIWNIETLKEYFQQLREADREAIRIALVSQKELLSQMHGASQEAIKKAEEGQLRYNQGHNDLSRKMEDQYKNMIPREEHLAVIQSLNEKIESIQKQIALITARMDELRGKGAGAWQLVLIVIALITIAGFIITYTK
jgi:hypothetical protein